MKTVLILALITSSVQIIGFVIYDMQAFRKMSSPNVASWLLWALITILNFTSYRSMSGDWMKSLLPTVSSTFCVLTFFVAIAKGGTLSKLNKFDAGALAIGIVAAFTWFFLKSAAYANLILQAAVLLGFVPTWRTAKAERPLPWFIWTAAYVLGVIVVAMRWTGQWGELVYPGMCIFAHLAVGIKSAKAQRRSL